MKFAKIKSHAKFNWFTVHQYDNSSKRRGKDIHFSMYLLTAMVRVLKASLMSCRASSCSLTSTSLTATTTSPTHRRPSSAALPPGEIWSKLDNYIRQCRINILFSLSLLEAVTFQWQRRYLYKAHEKCRKFASITLSLTNAVHSRSGNGAYFKPSRFP